MDEALLDREPVVIAVAGPNGAGKTTFFEAFLQPAALRFVNADAIASALSLEAYAAAELAERLRWELLSLGESFAFETVLSDPTGEKVQFLRMAADKGYTAVLCFIGVASAKISDERVAMRVTQGGHDVPVEKITTRYPRTLHNLARAIRTLPFVYVYDNSDLADPFRPIAAYRDGNLQTSVKPLPTWFRKVITPRRRTKRPSNRRAGKK